MPATILDGKQLAQQLRSELAEEIVEFIQNNGAVPCLAAVLVGDDPASEVYVRNKRRACEAVGIESQLHRLGNDASSDDLLRLIAKLNKDAEVHGILVQLPLPPQIDKYRVLSAVNPNKDVDAFHPENVGRLVQGRPRFLPCTPQGVQQLLLRNGIDISGKACRRLGAQRNRRYGRYRSCSLNTGKAATRPLRSATAGLPTWLPSRGLRIFSLSRLAGQNL